LHGAHSKLASKDDDAYLGFPQTEPSQKQLDYAEKLAQRAGITIPDDVRTHRSACTSFIDDALSMIPPSAAQERFATSLAEARGVPLPGDVLRSAKAVSEYINRNPLASGYSPTNDSTLPTTKQLLFAAQLARKAGMGLSHDALASKKAMSKFIDERLDSDAGARTTSQTIPSEPFASEKTAAAAAAMAAEVRMAAAEGTALAWEWDAGERDEPPSAVESVASETIASETIGTSETIAEVGIESETGIGVEQFMALPTVGAKDVQVGGAVGDDMRGGGTGSDATGDCTGKV